MNERTFTQEEVNEIIKNRLADEKAKTERLMKQKEDEWSAKLKEATAETTARLDAMKEEKRHGALLAALKEGNAAAPDEIAKLLNDKVQINDKGDVSYDKDGEAIPVKDGVMAYLRENPWALSKGQSYTPRSGEPTDSNFRALRQAMGLK